MIKSTPYFNAVLVTSYQQTTSKEGVILANPQTWATQKVVSVGPNCVQTKPGDIVLLNIEQAKKAVPLTIDNQVVLLLSERDILLNFDESEYSSVPNIEELTK